MRNTHLEQLDHLDVIINILVKVISTSYLHIFRGGFFSNGIMKLVDYQHKLSIACNNELIVTLALFG